MSKLKTRGVGSASMGVNEDCLTTYLEYLDTVSVQLTSGDVMR